jgi:hypothetical protein
MRCTKRTQIASLGLALVAVTGLAAPAHATMPSQASSRPVALAQAMMPPTGMMDPQHPMPMNEGYLKRFPQPARVGDLIGLPVLDLNSSTLGSKRRGGELLELIPEPNSS